MFDGTSSFCISPVCGCCARVLKMVNGKLRAFECTPASATIHGRISMDGVPTRTPTFGTIHEEDWLALYASTTEARRSFGMPA